MLIAFSLCSGFGQSMKDDISSILRLARRQFGNIGKAGEIRPVLLKEVFIQQHGLNMSDYAESALSFPK